MNHIVVDDEQAKIITESSADVEIRDRQGRHLGFVAQDFTTEDIETAKQRLASNEPRFTTAQVLEHLRTLERS